jgi:hypothetical protein
LAGEGNTFFNKGNIAIKHPLDPAQQFHELQRRAALSDDALGLLRLCARAPKVADYLAQFWAGQPDSLKPVLSMLAHLQPTGDTRDISAWDCYGKHATPIPAQMRSYINRLPRELFSLQRELETRILRDSIAF